MKAVVVDPHPSCPPLRVTDHPEPVLRAGWAIVRVLRASVNRNDLSLIRQRRFLTESAIPGSDGVGTVAAVGQGVSGLDVGSQVLIGPSLAYDEERAADQDPGLGGIGVYGTHAEYVAVRADNLYPYPRRLSLSQAAALPLAGATAWRGLTTRGHLRAGQTVVVTAASSGVGTFAVQIAHALGARVIAVTSNEEKARAAVALGASSAVLRTSEHFGVDLRDAVGVDGADLVFDSAGAHWETLLSSLRVGGRLVNVGRNAARFGQVDLGMLFWRDLAVLGSSEGTPADFTDFLDHVDAATWTPAIAATLDIDDAAVAYALLDAPGCVGKVVLDVSGAHAAAA